MKEYSAEKFKCEYCDSDISLLTKKLQQHPTSQLWLRHGQCCAACKSARETNGINNKELISIQDFDKIFNNNALKPEDHNTNLIHTLTRDSEIEDEAKLNMRIWARKMIRAGNIIATLSLVASFLLFYNEYFYQAIAALIVAVLGIVICRLGVWKKCRRE